MGYKMSSTKVSAFEGNSAIEIIYEGMSYAEKGKPLFEGEIKAGEIIKEQLANGVVAQIPMVLYTNDNKTLPIAAGTAELDQRIQEFVKDKSTEDLSVRLGNVIALYALIKHFYPYLEASESNLDKLFEQALKKSFADKTDAVHVETLQAFTAPLDDGHIRIYGKSYQRHAPDVRWEWIEEQLVVTEVLDSILNISVGDVVDKVNGEPAKDYYQQYLLLASASTDRNKQHQANTNSLLGKEGSFINVVINRKEHQLKRTHNYWNHRQSERQKEIHFKTLDNEISYVNLNVISIDSIQSLLPKLEASKAIIFDIRRYPNGNHGVIGLLMEEKDTNDSWMQIPQYIYPKQAKVKGTQKHGWELKPEKPYLGDKKVIFITSPAAISYAESFMGFIEGYDLATIVGQPTAGTNGNVNGMTLNDGIRFRFTGMLVYKFDGKLLHGRGIEPDVYVEKTIAGTKEGKDEFLEKAIEIAKAKN
jgi:C-terminal processing protease CtpA/Prc